MLFCEKCNFLTNENCCPLCGNKKLREVNDEDFCYFCSLDVYNFEMFEYTLKENDIDVIGLPYYTGGVSRANVGRASGRKTYIRYKDMENATEIYETIFGS